MHNRLTHDDIDRIFSVSAEDDPRLGSLWRFVRLTRETFGGVPSAEVQAVHLHAMAEAFAPGRAPTRRRILPRRPSALRVAMAAVFFVAGTAALAAAGDLGPAQNLVADTVSVIGLDLPGGSDDPEKGGHDAPEGEAGKLRAAQNRQDAQEFTEAKKAWLSCVNELRENDEGPGPLDPETDPPEGCGPKPAPHDFRDEVTSEEARTANPAGIVPGTDGDDTDGDDTGEGQGVQVQPNKGRGNQGGDDSPGNSGGDGDDGGG